MTLISWGIAEYLYDDCPPEWRLKHFATGVLIIQIIEFIIYVIMGCFIDALQIFTSFIC